LHYATVVCQKRIETSGELQDTFFSAFPKGLIYLTRYSDGSYITSHFHRQTYHPGETFVRLQGKPSGMDRFKFIPDKSGFGVIIQVATLDTTKNPAVPVFTANEGFISLAYKEKSNDFLPTPALLDRSKATIFLLTSRNGKNEAPFGLRYEKMISRRAK